MHTYRPEPPNRPHSYSNRHLRFWGKDSIYFYKCDYCTIPFHPYLNPRVGIFEIHLKKEKKKLFLEHMVRDSYK